MINFRKLQRELKCNYVNVTIGDEKKRVNLFIDRGGRIIDCTRIGRLHDRIYGRQLISLAGVNESIIEEINDEVDILNGKHFIPTI